MSQFRALAPPLQHPQAKTRNQAVLDAYTALELAYADYKKALVAATDRSSVEILVIRLQGREYRRALKHYCDAVTAWLLVTDTVYKDLSKRVWTKPLQ